MAQNGESALERVAYARPDLILLDVLMPGIDGFETCRRLKADDTYRDIPVIFMTALTDTVDKVKGFSIGAVDYITKPIQHEEVLARVTAHLTIRNLQARLQQQNKQLQQEIAERKAAQQAQAELIADLDAFAHTVAHDLKNPLSSIIANAQLLEEDWPSPDEQQEAGRAVTRGARRMERIINELLTLARMRKKDVARYPLDMGKIVAEVCEQLELEINQRQAQLIVPELWPTAVGHTPWIEEVWVNYISNALKYGGNPPHIELGSTSQTDHYIRFWVRDNGQGLTEEEQAQLFQPFIQLNRVRAEGYGLGLSIVQRIVEKLGGQVSVESEGTGQGCTFSFTLPVSESGVTDQVQPATTP